jgi:signal recognition particle subunit SRP54
MLKMHRTMADVMKAMSGGGKRGPMAGLANMLGLRGGAMPSAEQMQQLAAKMPGGGPGLPGLPGGGPQLPGLAPGMPGLPAKFPGSGPLLPGLGGKPPGPFGGFPGLGKKK